jgi:hypothetical protein
MMAALKREEKVCGAGISSFTGEQPERLKANQYSTPSTIGS